MPSLETVRVDTDDVAVDEAVVTCTLGGGREDGAAAGASSAVETGCSCLISVAEVGKT